MHNSKLEWSIRKQAGKEIWVTKPTENITCQTYLNSACKANSTNIFTLQPANKWLENVDRMRVCVMSTNGKRRRKQRENQRRKEKQQWIYIKRTQRIAHSPNSILLSLPLAFSSYVRTSKGAYVHLFRLFACTKKLHLAVRFCTFSIFVYLHICANPLKHEISILNMCNG